MAEIVGLTSGVLTLASAAYKSCQTVHNAIDGFRSASHQILALSSDLESFYLVLGTLQAALQDEACPASAVELAMSNGLSKTLEQSMEIFKKITAFIGAFKSPDADHHSAWPKAKWVIKEKSILEIRKELMECKMTLNIAICVANE